MKIENRLCELGLELPKVNATAAKILPAKIIGNLIFVSGSTPLRNGAPLYQGQIEQEVSLEQAQEAARLAMLCELAKAKAVLGDLDRITGVIKVNGYLAAKPGFTQQSAVMNAASDLLVEAFGEIGAHARTALGVTALPGNAPLEIETIFSFA